MALAELPEDATCEVRMPARRSGAFGYSCGKEAIGLVGAVPVCRLHYLRHKQKREKAEGGS